MSQDPGRHHSRESSVYSRLGASSSKDQVLSAVGQGDGALHFVEISPDTAGDPDWASILHADGAGTKSIAAYIAYRETEDPAWFSSLAHDSVVMNVDDVACVNAFDGYLLSNSIARNRRIIPDGAIRAIINGYRESSAKLESLGIPCRLSGGETADVGDVVRTLLIDSTLFARVKRPDILSFTDVRPGDAIVGLSSTGQSSYETAPNSGLGSNGYTLARHALIPKALIAKYPEATDLVSLSEYPNNSDFLAHDPRLGMSQAQALLSPTRTYSPIIKELLSTKRAQVHGIVHCTGGGQTKIARFGKGVRYVKENLFDCPPVFAMIQETMQVPWSEMYSVFNMGHRMEIICDPAIASNIVAIADNYSIAAQTIGRVEAADPAKDEARLVLKTPYGEFAYR